MLVSKGRQYRRQERPDSVTYKLSGLITHTQAGFAVLFQEFILLNTSKLHVIPRRTHSIGLFARSSTFPTAGCRPSGPGSGQVQVCRALLGHVQPHRTVEALQLSCLLPAGSTHPYAGAGGRFHTLSLLATSCTQIILLSESPHAAVLKYSKPLTLQNILHMNGTLSAPSDPGCTSAHRRVKYTLAL